MGLANGKPAVLLMISRQPNASDSASDSAIRPRITGEVQAYCVPPQVNALDLRDLAIGSVVPPAPPAP